MRRVRFPVVLMLILLAVVLVWAARRPLSEAAVARWFASRDVEARYRITALSPGGVTLADVSLGPAAHPELTAERVEARIGWSPLSPRVDQVTLVRPQLDARLSDKGFSLGSLDRLLPQATRPAQPLPDIDVRIVAGTLRVATPAGPLAGQVDGAGRLRAGFRGNWAVGPAALTAGNCAAAVPGAVVRLATTRDAVQIDGTGGLPRVACSGVAADAVAWRVAATLPPTLDRYRALATVTAARIGGRGFAAGASTVTLDAAAPELKAVATGTVAASVMAFGGPSYGAAASNLAGSFRFDPATATGSGNGTASVRQARVTVPTGGLRRVSRQLGGTLAAPLFERLVARGTAAARAFDASAGLAFANDRAGLRLDVSGLSARSASGTMLRQTGRAILTGASGDVTGGATVWGGGLPQLAVTATGRAGGGGFDGTATLAAQPWAVPGASLHALQIEARAAGGDIVAAGRAAVSGALGGGIVARRLDVPIVVRIARSGAVDIGTACSTVSWAGLSRDTLDLGPGAARACPAGGAMLTLAGGRAAGGAVLSPLALRGRMGVSPLALDTAPVRLAITGTAARPVVSLAPATVAVRYGDTRIAARAQGLFDLAAATGRGRIDDARYEDPAGPVAVDHGSGRWQLAGGRLDLAAAGARVTDRTAPARFQPLRIDAAATLADGAIVARGSGRLADGAARLFNFTATHALATGRGAATVETGILVFGPALQPYQITESMRGVVDNVRGPVSGSGRLAWDGAAVTSTGSARIDHVSLATASLGPVDDVAGTVRFDDLLAMTTPPGQVLTVARINPGVAVDDGVVHFRMLGPDAAAIEAMTWPYAGGTLSLAPVTIRAADTSRDFLLTVDNLDAALFLQKFDIKDVNVTGRFDGRLPLVFAGDSGRIVGGTLVARAGGGLVQYVGAVGGEDLGAGARLAFDALRRLRYQNLALDLDGDLDGELVTQLRFAGVNEAQATLGGGPLPIRATGLPFRFNVTVRAPFRALLGTAASFSDVRPLVRGQANGVQPR